jgi:hypothetical protein
MELSGILYRLANIKGSIVSLGKVKDIHRIALALLSAFINNAFSKVLQ